MPPTDRDADFWWKRYFGGLVLPALLILEALSQSALGGPGQWSSRHGIWFVPVGDEQALRMGMCYTGCGVALFVECYAQYHEKMAYHYQWLLAPGALMAGGGMLGCSMIFLFH